MDVNLLGDQLLEDFISTAPLPYTSHPLSLVRLDILLFIRYFLFLPNIVIPFKPYPSGELDELCPTRENLIALVLHLILIILQVLFILSLFLCFLLPFGLVLIYIAAFMFVNAAICRLLNGSRKKLHVSKTDLSMFPTHDDEKWIFLNGVAVGSHWLQCNIDRISLTFGRPVSGIHNPTSGIIFDVIQCLVQRDFSYATEDVRACYDLVKKSLIDPRYKKVIFMMHSQGAIEGGMILDWLFDDVPQDLVQKLEVYTFGNAASHFNNPHRYSTGKAYGHANSDIEASFMSNSSASMEHRRQTAWKAVRHIEHYANTEDFVARWGVLHFTGMQAQKTPTSGGAPTNRFMGRVFQRSGRGHQFNLHYLDTMFPLDWKRGWGTLANNDFMDSEARISETGADNHSDEGKGDARRGGRESLDQWMLDMLDWNIAGGEAKGHVIVQDSSPVSTRQSTMASQESIGPRKNLTSTKVRDVSRLWAYRNGMAPRDSW